VREGCIFEALCVLAIDKAEISIWTKMIWVRLPAANDRGRDFGMKF
jgi:hypothetical protein